MLWLCSKFKTGRVRKAMTTNIETETTTAPTALMPLGDLRIGKLNPFTTTAFYIPAQIDVSADELLDFAKKYANFSSSAMTRLYMGDILNTIKQRHPDVYGKAEELFPEYVGKRQQLRNIVSITAKVPANRRPTGTTFGHIRAVASCTETVQDELLAEAASFTEPITGERKFMTVEKLEERVKQKAQQASATAGEAEATATTILLQPPFSTLHIAIAGCAEGQKVAEWVKEATANALELIKRHSNADYRVKQEAKERASAVKELMKSVPTEDQGQFKSLIDSAATLKEITDAVKKYIAVAKSLSDLEAEMGKLPPTKQKEFEDMRAAGKSVSDIMTEVKKAVTVHTERTALDDIFKDSKLTEEERKPHYDK